MVGWTTANTHTEQLLYKHDVSGNKYSNIRSPEVITLIKKLLLSQKIIYLLERFDAHRNFPTVFSQKPSVYIYFSKKLFILEECQRKYKTVINTYTVFNLQSVGF